MPTVNVYEISVKNTAQRYLERKNGKDLKRLIDAIEALAQSPLDPRNKLAGGKERYRLRVGKERILYAVDKTKRRITIHAIDNRGQVYAKKNL